MIRPLLQLRNRSRPTPVRHRLSEPFLEVFEDRTLLSSTPLVSSSLQSFLIEGASQFGPGAAPVYSRDGFLGVAFDTSDHVIGGHKTVTVDLPWPFRDLDLGTYGAEATVGLSGRLGFNYGLSIHTGSADASYATEVTHSFNNLLEDVNGNVLVDTDVAVLGGSLDTYWPEVEAYLNLVLDVHATATLKAWFVSSLGTIGDDDVHLIGLPQELFFLDTAGANSDVRVLGQSVSGDIVDVSIPLPVPPPLEASFDANLTLQSDPLRLAGTNAITAGLPGAQVSTTLGESILTLAPSINLSDTTPDGTGRLMASSALDSYSRLASLSWELGNSLPQFAPREYSLAGIVTLGLTPVSFLAGPRIYAGQAASLTPSSLLTYRFDRPVPVQTGGASAPFVTATEVTFAPGAYLNIAFDGQPILVTPELRFGMDLHNRFTLDGLLGGTLTVGDLALGVNFGSSTTAGWAEDLLAEYLGFHREGGAVVISAGPLYSKNFNTDPLLSLPVFDRTFRILNEVRALPTFTIGEAVADTPLLTVKDATGDEDAPIPLDVVAALADTDGSESLSITVAGLPAGALLNHGTNQGGGVWTLAAGDLAGLTLLAPDEAAVTLTVTATATEASNADAASRQATLVVTVHNVYETVTARNDFNGDCKSDYAVFRPVDTDWTPVGLARWYTLVNRSDQGAELYDWARQWGLAGDIPVSGDYDGDGRTDYTVFRPRDTDIDPVSPPATWYIALNRGAGQGIVFAKWAYRFGLDGDIPVPGDYDDDGRADLALYRPSTGEFFTLTDVLSAPGPYVASGTVLDMGLPIATGLTGGTPVSGDFDDDDRSDYAVYHVNAGMGSWHIRLNRADGTRPYALQSFGLAGDIPVSGEYNGDGRADFAVYRPHDRDLPGFGAVAAWYIWLNLDLVTSPGAPLATPAPANTVAPYDWARLHGTPDDVPVAGDYNGDNKSDYAVYRPQDRTVPGYSGYVAAWYTLLNLGPTGNAVWDWGRLHGRPTDGPVGGNLPRSSATAGQTVRLAGDAADPMARTPSCSAAALIPVPVTVTVALPDPLAVVRKRKARLA